VITPMKYTARFINGAAFKPTDWGDDGKPIIRIAQLTGKDFDNYFDGERLPRYDIEDGDLLFSWSATLDSFIWDRGSAILNQHIFKVEPFPGTDKRFLYYSLKHYSQIWADVDAHGSTMRHIKKESLGNKIWFPELDRQIEIADFLDDETKRLDCLIEKKREFSDLIIEAQAAVKASAISGTLLAAQKTRDGEWLGKIPSDWKLERAKVHWRERVGRSEDGEEELLTASHITGVTSRASKDVNMFLAESNEGYKLVETGDIVINTMWAWMGAMGVSPIPGIISPSYGIYEPISDAFLPEFIDLLLRSRPFIAEATRRSKGIHSSRLRLYPDAFLDSLLPVPPIGDQKALIEMVHSRRDKDRQLLDLNQRTIDLLLEKRAALITAAVTGQLDLKTSSVVVQPANDNIPRHVADEIIRVHAGSRKFGRVKFQKLVYLVEAHCGIHEFGGHYLREPAGPLDRRLLNAVEVDLAEAGLYQISQSEDDGAVTYSPMASRQSASPSLSELIGGRAEAVSALIDKMRDMETISVEAVTTLYAVWNDFLIDGDTPTDEAIVQGVLEDWHPEKKDKFRADDLHTWLGWMRRNDLVPTGQGPRTSTGRLFV